MTLFAELLRNGSNIEIHLIQGLGQDGHSQYSFVAMEPAMAKKFKIDNVTKQCDASKYGTILYSGRGTLSDFIKQRILENYSKQDG